MHLAREFFRSGGVNNYDLQSILKTEFIKGGIYGQHWFKQVDC
jgi:hypothetical protein